jgi:ABC-type glycerol-3-phosphate transport system permease component
MGFIYSVFGIAWLDEPLPPYMTHTYALTPFQLRQNNTFKTAGNVSSVTTLYSSDVSCETPQRNVTKFATYLTSTDGCQVPVPFGPTGNETVGEGSLDQVKEFSAFYAGYDDSNGFADYYISSYCPFSANRTFFVSFTRNKNATTDRPQEPTVLFCQASYYSQVVNATVSFPSKRVLSYSPLGEKVPVPEQVFNGTDFEWEINSGQQRDSTFGETSELPGYEWPDQADRLADTNLSLTVNGADLPFMAGLSIGANFLPLDAYLDPTVLQTSYQAAYRLLFARLMVSVLDPTFKETGPSEGMLQYDTQAVFLVPGFTYAVIALLGCVSAISAGLLYSSLRRRWTLTSDPGSLAAVISLVADDASTTNIFKDVDNANEKELKAEVQDARFRLISEDGRPRLECFSENLPSAESAGTRTTPVASRISYMESFRSNKSKSGIRPLETSFLITVIFVVFHIAACIYLGYLFHRSQSAGMKILVAISAAYLPFQVLPCHLRIGLSDSYLKTTFLPALPHLWSQSGRLSTDFFVWFSHLKSFEQGSRTPESQSC